MPMAKNNPYQTFSTFLSHQLNLYMRLPVDCRLLILSLALSPGYGAGDTVLSMNA